MRVILIVIVSIVCASAQDYLGRIRSLRLNGPLGYGGIAKPKEFPWYVLLEPTTHNHSETYCGGSILNKDWILTAGHCVFERYFIKLHFGSTDVETMPLNMKSETWILHPDYNDTSLQNDIALVKIPEPLTYTDAIQPVQLISLSQAKLDLSKKIVKVAGFGYSSDILTQESRSLVYTSLRVISNDECREKFPARLVISSTLCARGYPNSYQSVCRGDSGSPLLMKDGKTFTQIGIASYTYENGCTIGDPSVFARVGSFLPWIHENTGLSLRP